MNRTSSNPIDALSNVIPAELRDSIFSVLLDPDRSTAPATISTTVVKSDTNIIIYAEMPGFDKDSIEVDFFNNKVNIAGTKNAPADELGRVLASHIKYGRFSKGLALPVSVTNRDNVSVSYRDGVLTVNIDLQKESSNKFSLNLSDQKEEVETLH